MWPLGGFHFSIGLDFSVAMAGSWCARQPTRRRRNFHPTQLDSCKQEHVVLTTTIYICLQAHLDDGLSVWMLHYLAPRATLPGMSRPLYVLSFHYSALSTCTYPRALRVCIYSVAFAPTSFCSLDKVCSPELAG
jgi:hypothetical protein